MTRPSKKPKHLSDIPDALPGRAGYTVRQVDRSKFDIIMYPADSTAPSVIAQKGNMQAAIRYAIKYQTQENSSE